MIAFDSERDGDIEVYRMRADGRHQTRLTFNPANDLLAAWSPDGRQALHDRTPCHRGAPGQPGDLHDARRRQPPGEPHEQPDLRHSCPTGSRSPTGTSTTVGTTETSVAGPVRGGRSPGATRADRVAVELKDEPAVRVPKLLGDEPRPGPGH